ncbi:unnamed protein product [Hyaloperonospora brassicae]|uniref:Uncharacterized protein n=1 Tax=Hyaloperonospora brassicae TaxID=162125 RepID=A0AAV0TK20_HYABA|nr:unnamed protein product [Hyaloperonospora brassicae]
MSNNVSGDNAIFEDGKMEIELTVDARVKQVLEQGYRDVAKLIFRPQWARNDVHEIVIERSPVAMLVPDPEQSRRLTLETRRRNFVALNERGLRVSCSH